MAFRDEVMRRCEDKAAPWNIQDLAMVIDELPALVGQVLRVNLYTKYGLPATFAMKLSIALGETPEFWMGEYTKELLSRLEYDPRAQVRLAAIKKRAQEFTASPKTYPAGYWQGYKAGFVDGSTDRESRISSPASSNSINATSGDDARKGE